MSMNEQPKYSYNSPIAFRNCIMPVLEIWNMPWTGIFDNGIREKKMFSHSHSRMSKI